MSSALPKSDEIAHELTDSLSRGVVLHEMALQRYLHEIEKLDRADKQMKFYLMALAYGAAGKKAQAIDCFEASLLFPDEIRANNYLSYLADKGGMEEYKELLFRLARQYEVRKFIELAHDISLYFGDVSKMNEFSAKYNKLSNEDEVQKMSDHFIDSVELLNLFKNATGLSEEDFYKVGKSAFIVMDRNSYKPSSVSFMIINEEKTNSYIVGVECDNASDIASMNIELAFELAEHEELLDKQFSAWFTKHYSVGENVNDSI